MKLLVVGAAGMLGQDLIGVAERAGHEVAGVDLPDIDITDPAGTERVVAGHAPDVVVNCAAFTDVDGAEEREETAKVVNGDGAGNVAEAARAAGARVVYISTDYVFDGDKRDPYVESDPTGPRTAYGRTKLAGEWLTASGNPDYVIARTAWLFGRRGKNFVETMLKLGPERGELKVVHDQVGCPTWTVHLAQALVELAASDVTGVVHTAGSGTCSWFEFAVEIFRRAGVDGVTVNPCTTEEFPRPAPRPAYSVLVSERDGAPVLPDWQLGLDGYLREREAVSA
jgi:dTDP-4-dehydrorhamnose reductase